MFFTSTRVTFTPHLSVCFVEDQTQLGVDLIALRKRMVEIHVTHHARMPVIVNCTMPPTRSFIS
jgi:hypothetical protein